MPDGGGAAMKPPQLGVWDQWCVLSDRPYVHALSGPALLDEAGCRTVLENFRASPDDLSCNVSHDKSKVVGTYNALALVRSGQVIDFATHDPTVAPPTAADLPGGDDGSPPDDGIYWRRASLTDIGLAMKPYLRKCSPEFATGDKNQFSDPIGIKALGGAWTNYPFLPGNELHEMERPMAKKTYTARCMEEAGTDDKDEAKYSKLAAYWRGKHGGASFSKFEKDAGVADGDDDDKKYSKVSAFMTGKFEGADEAGAGGTTEMEDPKVVPGAPTAIEQPKQATDPVPGTGKAELHRAGIPQQYEAALQQLPVISRENAQLKAQVQQLVAGQQKVDTDRKASEFTRTAWGKGQIVPYPSETAEQAQGRIVAQYTKFGEEAAKGSLAPEGTYATREMTAGPLRFEFTAPESVTGGARKGEHPDEAILRLARERQATNKTPDHRFVDEVRAVCQEHPHLYQKYSVQGRAALFEGILPGFGEGAGA